MYPYPLTAIIQFCATQVKYKLYTPMLKIGMLGWTLQCIENK